MGILLISIAVVLVALYSLHKMKNKKTGYTVDYPIAYHTVDIAIVKIDGDKITQVLLIQKPNEVDKGIWRFVGGFMDPTDMSAEDAAIREAFEETRMIVGKSLGYIGSSRIDDPRYRDSPHKIITSFYVGCHLGGEAGRGYDDVAKTQWFDVDDVISGKVKTNPTHAPLFELFKNHISKTK